MVYAEFGGQTECIMGNSKIENKSSALTLSIPTPPPLQHSQDTHYLPEKPLTAAS